MNSPKKKGDYQDKKKWHFFATIQPIIHWENPIKLDERYDPIDVGMLGLPSGKRLHSFGKPAFLMGKSTINGNFQ